jgi:hypothetical protein
VVIAVAWTKSSLLGFASALGAASTTSANPIVAATADLTVRRCLLDAFPGATARCRGCLTATTLCVWGLT